MAVVLAPTTRFAHSRKATLANHPQRSPLTTFHQPRCPPKQSCNILSRTPAVETSRHQHLRHGHLHKNLPAIRRTLLEHLDPILPLRRPQPARLLPRLPITRRPRLPPRLRHHLRDRGAHAVLASRKTRRRNHQSPSASRAPPHVRRQNRARAHRLLLSPLGPDQVGLRQLLQLARWHEHPGASEPAR